MKKIMFSREYGLEQAAIELLKTMTRRGAKLPPDLKPQDVWNPVMGIDAKGRVYFTVDCIDGKQRDLYPQYQIGEVVAIAQPYRNVIAFHASTITPHSHDWMREEMGWDNKMYVKAKWMPHQIRITNIKMERLQDIADEDCLREGIRRFYVDPVHNGYTFTGWKHGKKDVWCNSPRNAFHALIDKISGKDTWKDNPWVFVYEFELIK